MDLVQDIGKSCKISPKMHHFKKKQKNLTTLIPCIDTANHRAHLFFFILLINSAVEKFLDK